MVVSVSQDMFDDIKAWRKRGIFKLAQRFFFPGMIEIL
jgi:hypothetical protein